MPESPTARTLKALRKKGFVCESVERWNPFGNVRVDLFGIIDLLYLDRVRGIVGVQVTDGTNYAHRHHKLTTQRRQRVRDWLSTPGARLELWAWRQVSYAGTRTGMRWEARVSEITLADVGGAGEVFALEPEEAHEQMQRGADFR